MVRQLLVRATKKPPSGGLTSTWLGRVLYEMMMTVARSVRIGDHSIGSNGFRQSKRLSPWCGPDV
jgi:hypothetical protein